MVRNDYKASQGSNSFQYNYNPSEYDGQLRWDGAQQLVWTRKLGDGFLYGSYGCRILSGRFSISLCSQNSYKAFLKKEPNLLLNLFQGHYKAWTMDGNHPTESEVCTNKHSNIRLDKLSHQIQKDLRRIASKIIGLTDNPSIVADEDDAVIHFRCGDVLGGLTRNDFRMISFHAYKDRLYSNNTSIGIVTQPFDTQSNRGVDKDKTQECQRVVETLVEYLRGIFPSAKITIHNDLHGGETVPLAWARLILARQQAFTTLSSFGIFPVMGTGGQGYFQKGNVGVNPWAKHVPKHLPNLHQMNAPVMGAFDIHKRIEEKGFESLLEWFTANPE